MTSKQISLSIVLAFFALLSITTMSQAVNAGVLLQDDFQDGVVAANWNLWRMQFDESGGKMNTVSAPRPGFNYGHSGNGRSATIITNIGDPTWRDYRLELDVQALPVGAFNPHGVPACYRGINIIFRAEQFTESWNAPATTGYTFNIDTKNCSGWSTRGTWGLSRYHGLYFPGTGWNPQHSGSSKLITSGNSPAIVDGPNHVKIEAVGDNIKVWINNTAVLDYTETPAAYDPGQSPITYGGIGVQWGWESMGWLDNVVVTEIQPGSPNAAAVSSTAILLSWDNNLGGKGFRIQRKDGACNSDDLWATRTDISVNSDADLAIFSDQPLSPDTQYSYRVSSYYSSGIFGAYSPCASAITAAAGTPNVPVNLRAYSRSDNQVDLTWSDASETETFFNIYRRAGTEELTLLATVPEGTQVYKDTTASGNIATISYQYNITACNTFGCSRLLKPSEVPFRPSNFSATVGTAVKLIWKDNSNDETGFEIWRKNGDCASGSPWTRSGSVAANTRVFNDGNAVQATQYAYKVRAYYDNGAPPKARSFSLFTRCVSATAP